MYDLLLIFYRKLSTCKFNSSLFVYRFRSATDFHACIACIHVVHVLTCFPFCFALFNPFIFILLLPVDLPIHCIIIHSH